MACASGNNTISLKFTDTRLGETSAAYKYSWETYCPATVHIGPETCDTTTRRLENQCVFMCGFKLTIREGMAALRGRTKVSSVLDKKSGTIFPEGKASNIPFMDDGTWSFSGKGMAGLRNGLQRMHSSVEVESVLSATKVTYYKSISFIFANFFNQVYHPLNTINEYLLNTVRHQVVKLLLPFTYIYLGAKCSSCSYT